MDRGKAVMGVLGGLVSGLAVLAGSLAIVRALYTPRSTVTPQGKSRVVIRSTVAGAQVLVDGEFCGIGKCELELKPGTHEASARKPGYSSERKEFIARTGVEIELTSQPLPSVIEVMSDLMTGELRLDDNPPVPLSGGSAQLTGVASGEHRLRFSNGAFRADFQLDLQPGAPPRLLAPPAASGLRAVVVAGAGPDGRLWTSDKQAELAIGARELGLIPEEGLALPEMERGAHRFVLKLPRGQETAFVYEIAENPTAWISLRTNRKLGTLRILAGPAADDAKVIVDGKDSGARVRRGRALVLAAPGTHEISVEKAGFITPSEQRTSVQEGGESELEFKLQPVPSRALLPIAGAPPGTSFAIDDKPAGTAGLDGALSIGDLSPGNHVVTAQKEGYVSGRWEVKLSAGRNADLRASMARAQATLKIVTTPPGATAKLITLRRLGQFEERPAKESVLQLPEGDYTITAVDSNDGRVTAHAKLEAGKEAVVTLALSPPPPPEAKPEVSHKLSLSDWDGAPGWNRQGNRIVNEGGGIMLAPTRESAQSLVFTAHVRPGKPVRWVTQFRDVDNYTLYELRNDGLNRADIVAGKRISRNQVPLNTPKSEAVRVQMKQQAGVLRTSVFQGGQWIDLDTVDAPNGTGRFGFYLPEHDRLALSEFQYIYR